MAKFVSHLPRAYPTYAVRTATAAGPGPAEGDIVVDTALLRLRLSAEHRPL